MIKFTEIPERLNYPSIHKGRLSTLHTSVIDYVLHNFKMTYKFRMSVITALNTLTYLVLAGDAIPQSWSSSSPLTGLPEIDENECKEIIGDLFLDDRKITWDIEDSIAAVSSISSAMKIEDIIKPSKLFTPPSVKETETNTDKQDLYLKCPKFPQFNVNKVWCSKNIDGEQYTIYETLPSIPTKQNEISVTTNIDLLGESDLLRLFPNVFIPTRNPACYNEYKGVAFDNKLGAILPIQGFTQKQLIDNTIKYPHFYKLYKLVDGQLVNFYATIEIDGELHNTLEIWDSLPEAKKIPRNSELIKEYVIRRYLLERDIKHIEHKYPLYGTLDPFLTLFMPADDYASYGYKDPKYLATNCVNARISFKQSRNPVIRRIQNA